MLVRRVLSNRYSIKHKKIPVPTIINIYEFSGPYPLQQSLVIGSYAKMLVREVLSDKI